MKSKTFEKSMLHHDLTAKRELIENKIESSHDSFNYLSHLLQNNKYSNSQLDFSEYVHNSFKECLGFSYADQQHWSHQKRIINLLVFYTFSGIYKYMPPLVFYDFIVNQLGFIKQDFSEVLERFMRSHISASASNSSLLQHVMIEYE